MVEITLKVGAAALAVLVNLLQVKVRLDLEELDCQIHLDKRFKLVNCSLEDITYREVAAAELKVMRLLDLVVWAAVELVETKILSCLQVQDYQIQVAEEVEKIHKLVLMVDLELL